MPSRALARVLVDNVVFCAVRHFRGGEVAVGQGRFRMTLTPGPSVLVVMGVSGCGKSTVAAALAERLGWPFVEGDGLHPRANIERMAAGRPLTDADRWPWLGLVRGWIRERMVAGDPGVVTCSALRRAYRDVLRGQAVEGSGLDADPVVAAAVARGAELFVYLRGSREIIGKRLTGRHGHFMPPTLLDSQFATLQEPEPDENHLTVDLGPDPGEITQRILDQLGLDTPGLDTAPDIPVREDR